MNVNLPKNWYLYPMILFFIFVVGLTYAAIKPQIHDVWSVHGVYKTTPDSTSFLGYVQDDYSGRMTMIAAPQGANFKFDNGTILAEYSFFANNIQNRELITTTSIEIETSKNQSHIFTFVHGTGEIVDNSIVFSTARDFTTIHNFDKVLIPAGWKSIVVYKDGEATHFTDGYWSYSVVGDNVINVNMDGEDYATKAGFGGVCTDYDASTNTMGRGCPMVYQDFTRSYGDFWLYYPQSNEIDITITQK